MEIFTTLLVAFACFFGGYYFGRDSAKGKTLSEDETDAIRQVLAVLSFTGGADENKDKSQ
jgi:hypothetical protein